jgi:hypothetical protein
MARPRELYNTPAPQAMSLMGAGIADAYARAGEIEGKGMMAMGQGIAQGLTSAASSIAGAYGDYKKMQSQIKTSEGFYNTMKEGGYLPPEMTAGIDNTVNSDVYKNMGTAEKAQFWGDVKGYTGNALGQYYKMQQIEADQAGAMDRAKVGVGPQYANIEEQRRQREQDARNRESTNQKIEGFGKALEKYRGMFGGG